MKVSGIGTRGDRGIKRDKKRLRSTKRGNGIRTSQHIAGLSESTKKVKKATLGKKTCFQHFIEYILRSPWCHGRGEEKGSTGETAWKIRTTSVRTAPKEFNRSEARKTLRQTDIRREGDKRENLGKFLLKSVDPNIWGVRSNKTW